MSTFTDYCNNNALPLFIAIEPLKKKISLKQDIRQTVLTLLETIDTDSMYSSDLQHTVKEAINGLRGGLKGVEMWQRIFRVHTVARDMLNDHNNLFPLDKIANPFNVAKRKELNKRLYDNCNCELCV